MAGALDLIVSIAATHVRARLRQTLVGVLGVATGVGFSVMMAALMQGWLGRTLSPHRQDFTALIGQAGFLTKRR